MSKLIQTQIRRVTRKETTTEIIVGRDALLLMLRDAGIEVPASAEITVRVPGGADWSNTALHIDSDAPIKVRFSQTTTEGDKSES